MRHSHYIITWCWYWMIENHQQQQMSNQIPVRNACTENSPGADGRRNNQPQNDTTLFLSINFHNFRLSHYFKHHKFHFNWHELYYDVKKNVCILIYYHYFIWAKWTINFLDVSMIIIIIVFAWFSIQIREREKKICFHHRE